LDNRVLKSLPAEELELLRAELERAPLTFRQVLQDIDQPLTHLWFPRTGVLSMVSEMEDGSVVEVATVGREGLVGISVVLEADEMAQRIFAQIEGEGDRIPVERFRALRHQLPALNRMMLRYAASLVTMVAQGSACNRMHPIDARCARWLLQTHDRVDSDGFYLTHEFLAQMLGVTRPSVTIAAGILQQAGMIEYNRGQVTIVDRGRLEDASCECYGVVKSEMDRLVSPA
jgi:CRP-like cAMP-binding protein